MGGAPTGWADIRGAYAERLFGLTSNDYISSYGGGALLDGQKLGELTPGDYFPYILTQFPVGAAGYPFAAFALGAFRSLIIPLFVLRR